MCRDADVEQGREVQYDGLAEKQKLAAEEASADRSDAIRKIREARMTANAAIALNGLSL